MFQSLFYWKYLSDFTFSFTRSDWRILFQSLFYWKYLSDDTDLTSLSVLARCFNPCFIGSIFQTPNQASLAVPQARFNPCFIGSIFQTADVDKDNITATLFQSLFYWKYLSDVLGLQSGDKESASFNPCFIGSIFQTEKYISKL